MKTTRLLTANFYWYIRLLMENNGFLPADYKVIYSYPDHVEMDKFPLIAIDKSAVRKQHFQIGGADRTIISLIIDVIANSRDQKDDISTLIQDHFHEQDFELYDFTNNFPISVGNYSGIPSLGLFSVNKVAVVSLQPPQFSNVPSEKHHDMIVMEVSLPI